MQGLRFRSVFVLACLALGALVVLSGVPAEAASIVPDVTGKKKVDALDALDAVDLVGKVVKFVDDPSHPAGIVIAQDPAPGTAMLERSTVKLTVNRGGIKPTPSGTIVVPKIVGSSFLDAMRSVQAVNLTPDATRIGTRIAGALSVVLTQNPAAGTLVPAGSTVRFTHSNGRGSSALVRVPDFVGMGEPAARTLALASGLDPRFHGPVGTPSAQRIVDRQNLTSGVRVSRGSRIRLRYISMSGGTGGGGGTVVAGVVPNFIGMTEAQVSAAASKAGLSLRMSRIPVGTGVTPRATSQNTPAGTRVGFGTSVTVDFFPGGGSSGGTGVITPGVVPNFVGMTQAEARAAGRKAQLLMRMVNIPVGGTVAPRVGSQRTPAGTRVGSFARVTVDFSPTSGGGPVTTGVVPNFIGMTPTQARNAATRAGVNVRLGPIPSFVSPVVNAQSVAPGTFVGNTRQITLGFGNAGGTVGPVPTVMPNMLGWTEARARAFASRVGKPFSAQKTWPPANPALPVVVTKQAQAPGTLLSTMLWVQVTIGNPTGSSAALLPNMTGWTDAQVRSYAMKVGKSYAPHSAFPRANPALPIVVIRQRDAAGTPLASIRSIHVTFGNASTVQRPGAGIIIPAIPPGQSAWNYMQTLRKLGLSPHTASLLNLGKTPTSTTPAVGSSVARGTRVVLNFR